MTDEERAIVIPRCLDAQSDDRLPYAGPRAPTGCPCIGQQRTAFDFFIRVYPLSTAHR
jgi:hypothetical protein